MAAIQYPDFFPCPNWQYGETETAFAGRTPFDCGWTRQRRAHPDQYAQLSLTFTMDTDLFARWSTWVNASGYDWFTIRLDKFAGEKQPIDIRFISVLDYRYESFDIVRVTVSAEEYGEKPNPDKPPIPPFIKEPGCLSWGVDETVLIGSAFWVSVTNIDEDEFRTRCDNDTIVAIKNDYVYAYKDEDIFFTSTFNGIGMDGSQKSLAEMMPTDIDWQSGEKYLPGDPIGNPFAGRAWDYPELTGLPLNFVMTAWKWSGSSLLCCFFNTSSNASCIGYMLNTSGLGNIVNSGFGENVLTEDGSLDQFFRAPPSHVVEDVRTFSINPTTVLGTSYYTVYEDPFPGQHQWNHIGATGTVTVANGLGSPRRMEAINDNIVWYGPWATGDGATQSIHYGYVSLGFSDSTANTFEKEWTDPPGAAGVGWWPTTSENYPTRGVGVDWIREQDHNILPISNRQRPSKWFREEASEYMVAGPVNDWTIYKWTTISSSDPNFGATEIDLLPEKSFTNVAVVECVPVADLGAFVLAQLNASNLQRVNIKISATAEPGSWSENIQLTLSKAMHASATNFHIDYSFTQNKLMLSYRDSSFKLRIDTFESPFTCLLYEDA